MTAVIILGSLLALLVLVATWAAVDIFRMHRHMEREWWPWFRTGYIHGKPEPIYHWTWPLNRLTM